MVLWLWTQSGKTTNCYYFPLVHYLINFTAFFFLLASVLITVSNKTYSRVVLKSLFIHLGNLPLGCILLLGQSIQTMRSLPPPRITRARRWKRIKRALKNLITKGYISDYGVFHRRSLYSRHFHSITTVHKSPILSRMKKRKTDLQVFQTANSGLRFAKHLSAFVARFSIPGLKEDLFGSRRGKIRLSLKV
ncbi:hypothetical protein CORT_0A05330 [Candida orthopsilosis Co 90-125]|uniref:Uncharacterized protein n=1 Tax=Candida orthopsilosis (strain 90-125) TaxID=1136231 RepID=H8WXX4_CANO9|nr:hypothetical protein CORT_0A05330 [Candida orthopsilosis Co 90-125]CCG20921.1 hypothetical protein CORT_0A05330 [Candida orthopsilosis Co 90-125]